MNWKREGSINPDRVQNTEARVNRNHMFKKVRKVRKELTPKKVRKELTPKKGDACRVDGQASASETYRPFSSKP